jgi:signal transduction histidine kinase/putative methionine-R-sulfoxide reductase with GAF domain
VDPDADPWFDRRVNLKAQSRTDQLLARIAELESALAREERISGALREVGVALGTTLDLDRLLELILEKIKDLLDADRATVYLLDEAKGELVSRVAVGDSIRSVRLNVSEGIAGLVARTGKTIRVRDAYRDKRFMRKSDELPGYRTQSILAAPMKNHLGRIIGVVHVLNKKSHREFTAQDEALLNAFATEAAISVDNSRLFLSVVHKNVQLLETKEKLEQGVRHLKLLFELESAMSRAASQEDLVRCVLEESAVACDAAGAAALLSDQAEGPIELLLWDRERPTELERTSWRSAPPEGISPTSEAVRDLLVRAGQSAGPVKVEPRADGQRQFGVDSALAVALDGEDRSQGAMALFDKYDGRPFSAEDVELSRLIAANFSTAIRLFRARVQREREERLSAIGSLLSSVIHDLKSPIAVVGGYVQMMANTADEAKRMEYADLVLKQFDNIAAMQREVLEFARGEKRILVRRVYVAKYFEELTTDLKREFADSGVEMVLELGDKGTARFDENKIARAVHNLVRNAVEAMGPRGGRITLRVSRKLEGKGKGSKKGDLVLEVADTGPGIPKEIEGRLFQSFVTASKKGGTGLGLAIVHKIAREHGGSVSARSTSSGTTFTLILPQHDLRQ